MFSCGIEGVPEPSIRWFKDDALIDSEDADHMTHMDGVLEISSVQFSDFGRYKCRTESMKRTRVSENVALTQDSDVCECRPLWFILEGCLGLCVRFQKSAIKLCPSSVYLNSDVHFQKAANKLCTWS